MSGEAQRQRNMELGIRDIRAKVGEPLKVVNILIHDFNNEEPQEPKIYVKDGVKFVLHSTPLTAEMVAEYEAKIKDEKKSLEG